MKKNKTNSEDFFYSVDVSQNTECNSWNLSLIGLAASRPTIAKFYRCIAVRLSEHLRKY